MKETKIPYVHHTFNPWWGCVEVSPGCDRCYARGIAARFGFTVWGDGADIRRMAPPYWRDPERWNADAAVAGERRRVLCGSMCDVMQEGWRQSEERRWLFELIEKTPSLIWILLTKRPENFKSYLPAAWQSQPRANVWLATTVESAAWRHRIYSLRAVKAAAHVLSCEPLLAPMGALDLTDIEWVIGGRENGPGARPYERSWFLDLAAQCADRGVPYYQKDGLLPVMQLPGDAELRVA